MHDFLIWITEADTLTSPSPHLKHFAHLRAADNLILPESLIQSTTQTYGSPEDELLGEEIHTHTLDNIPQLCLHMLSANLEISVTPLNWGVSKSGVMQLNTGELLGMKLLKCFTRMYQTNHKMAPSSSYLSSAVGSDLPQSEHHWGPAGGAWVRGWTSNQDFKQAAFVRRRLKQIRSRLGRIETKSCVESFDVGFREERGLHMNRLTYLQKSLAFVGQTLLQLLMTHSLWVTRQPNSR